MALGDNYNKSNTNNNKNYSPTVYSVYKFNNAESKIDPTTLAPSFWNGMLKLTIAPKKETNNGEIAFDYDQSVSMYLTHTKARLLLEEIEEFQKNPDVYKNVGVSSGSGLISLTNGSEFGVNSLLLVIRKLNAETGQVENSIAYEFKQEYHYTIRDFDESSVDFSKVFYDTIELEQFKTLLKSYYEAMTGAVAYSVIDNLKYDTSRMNTKLDLMMDKLGIERKGNYSNKSSNSIFDNKESRTNNYKNASMDDLVNDIG